METDVAADLTVNLLPIDEADRQPRSESWSEREIEKFRTLRSFASQIPGGFVCSAVMIVLDVSAASIVMRQRFPEHLAEFTSLSLLCGAVMPSLLMLLGSEVQAPICADTFIASLFADIAASIGHQDSDSSFGTLLVAMVITTFVLGIFFRALGHLGIGHALAFAPAPVLKGYLASMGIVLINSVFKMTTTCDMTEISCVTSSSDLNQLVIALCLGIALFAAQTSPSSNPIIQQLLLPATLVVGTGLFQMSWPLGRSKGEYERWVLDLSSNQSYPLFSLPNYLKLDSIRWADAVRSAFYVAGTAALPSAIGRLLVLSSLETQTGRILDTSLEFVKMGDAQAASSLTAMTPNFSLAGFNLANSLGARGPLSQIISIAVQAAVALGGVSSLSMVPKVLGAAPLVSAGCNFLLVECVQAWRHLGRREFVLVVLHCLFTLFYGMAVAVGFGLLSCICIFVYESSRLSGVLQAASSDLERSRVARGEGERRLLDEHGASTLILHLYGVLFFGSASQVSEAVRRHTRALAERQSRLYCVVLDCEQCSSIDSSAASVLVACREQCGKPLFLLAGATRKALKTLGRRTHLGDVNESGACSNFAPGFVYCDSLDLALEHAENLIISSFDVSPTRLPPSASSRLDDLPADPRWAESRPSVTAPGVIDSGLVVRDACFATIVTMTPEQAQHKLNGRAVEQMAERLQQHVGQHGASVGFARSLVQLMDVLIVPPGRVIQDYSAKALHAHDEQSIHRDLLFVDSGFVSLTLPLPKGAPAPYRIAKMSCGAALGAEAFVACASDGGSGYSARSLPQPLPTRAVADTFVQLLRLPTSRFQTLERTNANLANELLRVLCSLAHQSARRHIVSDAASKAFKVGVQPSASLEALLTGVSAHASLPLTPPVSSAHRDQVVPTRQSARTTRSHEHLPQRPAARSAKARVHGAGIATDPHVTRVWPRLSHPSPIPSRSVGRTPTSAAHDGCSESAHDWAPARTKLVSPDSTAEHRGHRRDHRLNKAQQAMTLRGMRSSLSLENFDRLLRRPPSAPPENSTHGAISEQVTRRTAAEGVTESAQRSLSPTITHSTEQRHVHPKPTAPVPTCSCTSSMPSSTSPQVGSLLNVLDVVGTESSHARGRVLHSSGRGTAFRLTGLEVETSSSSDEDDAASPSRREAHNASAAAGGTPQ